MKNTFFPQRPKNIPKIYAYKDTHPEYNGLLKVGYTTRDVKERLKEHYPTQMPGECPGQMVLEEKAIRSDGTTFTDHDVHRYLKNSGVQNPKGEWFRCSIKQVKAAVNAICSGQMNLENRDLNFKMRPEQEMAVKKTADYFKKVKKENKKVTARFLWNAKMRFGKTFGAYQLAKKMKWSKVLVLTFMPAAQSAWEEDLKHHIDFEGWQFISKDGLSYDTTDKTKPIVCFGSFQDYLGKNKDFKNGIKAKNKWVHATHWDCIIFDEYHYGAWRDKAQDLFETEEEDEIVFIKGLKVEDFNDETLPITRDFNLYLSGTPFRAIQSGSFVEEQIFTWTYSDEQDAKQEWKGENNPYLELPRMVLMTYQLPDSIKEIASKGEFNEFDLNVFFSTSGKKEKAKFVYQDEVQRWLDLIRGSYLENTVDDLKQGMKKPPMPFGHTDLLNVLSHTLWFLPRVASCYAMSNLLEQKQNRFYHDYCVVVAAGSGVGVGVKALGPVYKAMDNPLKTKTITLSCGKLTSGVTVRPWTGIFMLSNTSSPEKYFQTAFRAQSPWTIHNPEGDSPNKKQVIKKECYVFDFAPDRALQKIAEYSCRLNTNESNPEKKVEEFIRFLPVLSYDGSSMKEVNAVEVLDLAMSGTTATLLARRWNSARLVNVDNDTLKRLMANKKAMEALMNIEAFRGLNLDKELGIIINKSEDLNKIKRDGSDKEITAKKKKELSNEEKEYRKKRKDIQEKLIKFATRIPSFMYLTDYREHCLKNVITELEPGLFKKVTGLSVKDFELLVSLNVFNSRLMNEAIYNFKRYEDSSLIYTGINKYKDGDMGLWDTVVSPADQRKDDQRPYLIY
jgi:hypothetical protein